jgi:hypothetical protein
MLELNKYCSGAKLSRDGGEEEEEEEEAESQTEEGEMLQME